MIAVPEERELLIRKLIALYPNFEQKHKNEIDIMRNQIGYERFSAYWLNGEAKKGRAIFKPFLKYNKKLAPYVFSYFMPASFFYILVKVAIKMRLLNKVADFH